MICVRWFHWLTTGFWANFKRINCRDDVKCGLIDKLYNSSVLHPIYLSSMLKNSFRHFFRCCCCTSSFWSHRFYFTRGLFLRSINSYSKFRAVENTCYFEHAIKYVMLKLMAIFESFIVECIRWIQSFEIPEKKNPFQRVDDILSVSIQHSLWTILIVCNCIF